MDRGVTSILAIMPTPTDKLPRLPRIACGIALAAATIGLAACGSEQSVNVHDSRLSGATNRTMGTDGWGLDDSAIEERWDEDPTVMEPDYPLMAPQPGFANQGYGSYGS